MQKGTIEQCAKLAENYHNLSDSKEKDDIRNKLFFLMQEQMAQWIESLYVKKKIFLEKGEIVSLGYECFEFCLKHYKPQGNIPIPNHFYSYTSFYLRMHYFTTSKFTVVELDDNTISENIDIAYEHLDELREFKKTLPEGYHSVFDDALMSLVDSKQDRLRRLDETNLSYQKYCESKKVFKIVIDYLLRR